MRVHYQWVIIVCLSSLSSFCQQSNTGKDTNLSSGNNPVTGAVSGHVYLADTKALARKATVYLQPVGSLSVDETPDHHSRNDNGLAMSLETSFDGSFSFTHVPMGSYYVVAVNLGYVSPFASLSAAEGRSSSNLQEPVGLDQKAAKEHVLKSLSRVDVQFDQPVSVDVVLERGGAISGAITYDDGTPAIGVRVSALIGSSHAGKDVWTSLDSSFSHHLELIESDDRGNYRISGLPAGKYIVVASLNATKSITYISKNGSAGTTSNGSGSSLTIYSGNTPRQKDASSFSIALGEERRGEDIQIPLSKLHTVSGSFVSALDGHVINSGQAQLFNADDKSFIAVAHATQDEPRFVFYFVYEGDYILSSPMSADVDYVQISQPRSEVVQPPQYDANAHHFYGYASVPLHVEGDMDNVTLKVPEPTAKEAQMFKTIQQAEQNRSKAPR